MSAPSVLVVAGHGLNCEDETLRAFELAGAVGRIVHLDDLVAAPEGLRDHRILALPGGFSFGDHTGAGKALANRLAGHLADAIRDHLARGGLAIGICNGCQALVKSSLWTEDAALARSVGIAVNDTGSYVCRWEPVRVVDPSSPWLSALADDPDPALPIAHGEGRFAIAGSAEPPIGLAYAGANPNGSHRAAAGLLGHGGRALALMPHPERAVRFSQRPDWTLRRERARRAGAPVPDHGPGLALFRSAVAWFAE